MKTSVEYVANESATAGVCNLLQACLFLHCVVVVQLH